MSELQVLRDGVQARADALERGNTGSQRELEAVRADCLEQRKKVITLEGVIADVVCHSF